MAQDAMEGLFEVMLERGEIAPEKRSDGQNPSSLCEPSRTRSR
jgi:hypothetical protein